MIERSALSRVASCLLDHRSFNNWGVRAEFDASDSVDIRRFERRSSHFVLHLSEGFCIVLPNSGSRGCKPRVELGGGVMIERSILDVAKIAPTMNEGWDD